MKRISSRTVMVEFVGGPICGATMPVRGDACPVELPDPIGGGRYVLTDRASGAPPYRPLYFYRPAAA